MPLEIERKFLVKSDAWREGATGTTYRQGYIGADKDRSVRVRVAGDKAFLTLKGASKSSGALTRLEFDYPIPLVDAELMLNELCDAGQVHKIRYKIPHEGLVWEVDEFLRDNKGLVVAEVELPSENTPLSLPSWVGEEVTQDARYANACLAHTPFSQWKKG